jgi:hypothetical protein
MLRRSQFLSLFLGCSIHMKNGCAGNGKKVTYRLICMKGFLAKKELSPANIQLCRVGNAE